MSGWRETVTSADGSSQQGTCDEAHASNLLQRAVRLGYTVEATRNGGAVIVREIPAATDHYGPPRRRTVTLEPAAGTGKVTATMRQDLALITARTRRMAAHLEDGRINGVLFSVPPGVTARLIQRGLVTVTGETVTVSLAARLAMLAQDHQTWTREPVGYAHPLDLAYRDALRTGREITLTTYSGGVGLNKPGRRAGKVYDRGSAVTCSCGGLSLPTEDRDAARRKAHEHRQQVTAAFVRELAQNTG